MNPIPRLAHAARASRRCLFFSLCVSFAFLFASGFVALAVGIDTLKIRGTVLGPDGKGLARAAVRLIPANDAFEPDPSLPAVTIKSNRKGRFTLPFVKPGRYLLEVSAEGLAPRRRPRAGIAPA